MKSAHMSRCIVLLLALATLVLAVGPAAAASCGTWGQHPSVGPGPAHGWGTDYHGPAAFGGCHGPTGRPGGTVNTYTGNLTISDIPAYYFQVGDPLPLEFVYNSHSGRLTTLDMINGHWTHSYDVYVHNEAPNGVTVFEGNGWEHCYAGSPTPSLPEYTLPPGVFDRLLRTYNDQGVANGWKLIRTDYHVLYFTETTDHSGRLDHIDDADGLSWTLSYIQYPSGGKVWDLLRTITDPLGNVTTLEWNGAQLTWIHGPGGSVTIGYHTYGTPPYMACLLNSITDASGHTYSFDYPDLDDYMTGRIRSIAANQAYVLNYTYATTSLGEVVSSTQLANSPHATLTTFAYSDSGTERTCTITDTKNGQPRATRHIYSSGTGPVQGALKDIIQDFGDSSHLNLRQTWARDTSLRLTGYRDSYQPETGGKAHRHFFHYGDPTYNPEKVTKYIDPENSDANPSDTGTPSPTCPGYVLQYDTAGNLFHVATPENRSADILYTMHRPTSVTVHDADINGNPVDRVTQFAYYGKDKGYELQSVTDARANVTSFDYDPQHWCLPTTVTVPGNRVWTFTPYTSTADIQYVTDPNGNQTSYTYSLVSQDLIMGCSSPSVSSRGPAVGLRQQCVEATLW